VDKIMATNLFQTIKKLRLQNNFSQEFMAEKLGMSRPTYMQIEKGERELTISEAQKLASIFSMTLKDLLNGDKQKMKVDFEKEKKIKKAIKQEIRISVPQQNLKKFKEVLLYILEKVGARPNIGETAIYKLLYFIDFDYYEKFEEQLIGAKYIKNHFGPTPIEFKNIIAKMQIKNEIEKIKSKYFQYEQKKYLPRRTPDLNILSAREIQHIDDVLSRLAGKSAKELSEYSHGDIPWKVHKNGEVIDYETVFYRDNKYSVREYDDEL
jgi:transcriptional regulator with XRE-family HTH domain